MDKMRIRGGKPLNGQVRVSGSKNAALPILISALLTGGKTRFTRVPHLNDIRTTLKLLEHMGVKVQNALSQNEVTLDASHVTTCEAPYDLVRTMRASIVVLGPLLARFGKARVSLPGAARLARGQSIFI